MLNADILGPLSVISYGFLILPLFNNRQASLNNLAHCRSVRSCMGSDIDLVTFRSCVCAIVVFQFMLKADPLQIGCLGFIEENTRWCD